VSLSYLRRKGAILPPIEDEGNLPAKAILKKIRDFYFRKEQSNTEIDDFAEGYFLELLRDYPQSMCSQHMTNSLKQLIGLLYFEDRMDDKPKAKGDWEGYSYEHLALIFVRSKATIYQAIHEKETEVKQLLTEGSLRQKARGLALEELVNEEKEKLKLEQNNQKNEQGK